jgi:hypothetical protein
MAEILNIKKALERRLQAITPVVPTGYEGDEFTPPANAMYQRCQFVIGDPTDPTFPAGYHRENWQMQVFVCDIKGKGTGAALARAELLRNTFPKALSLIESTTRIYILETPRISSAFIAGDRIIVPVIIPVTGEVYQ